MIITVARILGLARLGRRILDETDVLELAPHLGEDIRRDEAANVIHDDVLRPHLGLVHELADHGQNHLRGSIGVVVGLRAVLAVVQIDFDGHDFARLIAALVHAAGILVVILEDRLPGLLAVGGAGEFEQRGGQHGIHPRLIGVGVQPPLITLLFPMPAHRAACGSRAHTTRPGLMPRATPTGSFGLAGMKFQSVDGLPAFCAVLLPVNETNVHATTASTVSSPQPAANRTRARRFKPDLMATRPHSQRTKPDATGKAARWHG
jgi:hypothetical protein